MQVTNKDFDSLSWHDSKVYAVTLPDADYCIKIDIDFILEWGQKENGKGYQFLVAPAILQFEGVSNLAIKIEMDNYGDIYIDEIKRQNQRRSPNGQVFLWDFVMLLDKGEITFTAYGFKQELTNSPKWGEGQIYDR